MALHFAPHASIHKGRRLPGRLPGNTLSSGYEGTAQGDASAGRPASHPVRRRGGAVCGHRARLDRPRGGKNAIEDHIDTSFELERMLEDRGKEDLIEQVREVSEL